jgi:lysine-ketoglutarate reductase/saccharopine dehydrogenase-like protein (TIGR00300 family)
MVRHTKRGETAMGFELKKYTAPDFTKEPFVSAPDAVLAPAPKDKTAPENYHATTIFPEYFKVDGTWLLAEESRMDCVAVYENGRIAVREFRTLKQGDLVFVGRTEEAEEGIFVWTHGFEEPGTQSKEAFAFRQGRSRETAFSKDYDHIYELLKHEKDHGYVVWVMGPACAFDSDSREAFSKLVMNGYVDALLAGNALATHDLEGAYKKTALGQDIYTQESFPGGHYNHIDTINRVRYHGSIPEFIEKEHIDDGIMYSCVKKRVPFVLTGSIRDDGPLPEVYADVYEGQSAMRECVKKATTVICMATTLHSIATGNMTPSFRVMPDGTIRQVYFYSVDISEFAVNKLGDRGSLSAKSIVTNVQDFVVNVSKGLGL